MTRPEKPMAENLAVIFDVGNVLVRWDSRLLFRHFLPDDAAIDAFLAETGFHDWNLALDAGGDWDEAVAALSARHPRHAAPIRAFHERWHETLPGAIDGSVAILDALAAAGVPLYAITNYSAAKWAETLPRFPFLATSFRDTVVSGQEGVTKPDPRDLPPAARAQRPRPRRLRLHRRQREERRRRRRPRHRRRALHHARGAPRRPRRPRPPQPPSANRLTSRNRPSAPSENRQIPATAHRRRHAAARTPPRAPPGPPRARRPPSAPVRVMWKRKRSST